MRYFLLIIALLYLIGFSKAQQTPLLCNFPDEIYAGQEIFPRIQWDSQSLALVSWNSSETVQVLEAAFPIEVFEPVAWSPSCQYLVAKIEEAGIHKIIVWNAYLGQRVGILEGYASRNRIAWSQSENYLVIQLREGGYLWALGNNQQTLLNANVDNYERSFYSVEWDEGRNQVLTVEIASGNGVKAYDLATGIEVGFYHIGERSAPVTYRRYNYNQSIIVYSSSRENSHDGLAKGLAIWDRDSHTGLQLDNNYETFGIDSTFYVDIIGTTSSHYFILSDYGVYEGRLYIWDLYNLIGEAPYIPNYQHRQSQAGEIRLVDNHLEVADWYLWGYVYTPARIRTSIINLATMSLDHQSRYRDYDFICPNPPSELEWGCEQATNYDIFEDSRTGVNSSVYYAPR